MVSVGENKQAIQDFIQAVWVKRNLTVLGDFWTDDCINHAMPGPNNNGLEMLRAYHESFFDAFAAFSNVHIDVLQQIAEGDRVATSIATRGEHSGSFSGLPPTGRSVSMMAVRIDRLRDGKIAEHWSVSDLAGLMQQLHA